MRSALLLSLLVLASGCSPSPAPAPSAAISASPTVALAYRVVLSEQVNDLNVLGKFSSRAFKSAEELWTHLRATLPPAYVASFEKRLTLAFESETGILLTPGTQGDTGTQMNVTTLTEADGKLVVRFSAYGAGGGATFSQPILYLAVPRTEREVDIRKDEPCRLPPSPAWTRCR